MSGIRHKILRIKTIAVSAAALMLADTAAAQQVSLEEIVVTARKRKKACKTCPCPLLRDGGGYCAAQYYRSGKGRPAYRRSQLRRSVHHI